MTPTVVVDGKQFSLWTQGIYLCREGTRVIIVRESDCLSASEALRQGKTVYLSEDGEIHSTLRRVDGKYIQENLDEDSH